MEGDCRLCHVDGRSVTMGHSNWKNVMGQNYGASFLQ